MKAEVLKWVGFDILYDWSDSFVVTSHIEFDWISLFGKSGMKFMF